MSNAADFVVGVTVKRGWRNYLLGGLLGALVMLPTPTGGEEASASALYKKGLRSFRAGNLEQALQFFKTSEDADPLYPYPAFALARIYQALFEQEMRHYGDAVAAYKRLVLLLRAEPPSQPERALYQAYYFQGLLYLKGGEYEAATRSLRTFLEIYPDFHDLASVYNAIGIALYYQDQYDQAVASFRRALATEPDFPEARFNLRSVFTRLAVYNEAQALARAGELGLATEKVDQLKKFAPRYLPGRRLEAQLHQGQGDPIKALQVYGEILGLDPDSPITYAVRLEMARILERQGEREEALVLLYDNQRRFPRIGNERVQKQLEELIRRLEDGG